MPPLKRRHTPPDPRNKRTRLEHEVHEPKTEPASITIEAHEAHIITDKPSLAEAVSAKDEPGSTRGGLIRWFGETDEEIYVDRFDALLLLTSLPPSLKKKQDTVHYVPSSPDESWEQLPSDAEDTFFLTPSETEAYRQKKRLDMLEKSRRERILALEAEEAEQVKNDADKPADDDAWGGSDEEPDAQQLELMKKTANHIRSSANPGQLEMRILANHGTNPKFAFLRGRWKKRWQALMKPEESKAGPSIVASGGLVGYGSDDDSNSE